MELAVAEALWVLGELPREDLPAVAATAMEVGLDSPSLRELAGLTPPELDTGWDRFEAALQELGRPRPDTATAIRRCAVTVAQGVVAGDVQPHAGSRRMWKLLGSRSEVRDSPELWERIGPFIGLASEWENVPSAREEIDRQILAQSEAVVRDWRE
jgi:hypothetical protein